MIRKSRQQATYIAGDFLAVSLAWLAFNIIRYFNVVVPYEGTWDTLWAFLSLPPVLLGQIVFPLMMVGLYWLSGYYTNVFVKSRAQDVLTTLAWNVPGVLVIFFSAIVNDPIPDRASNLALLGILYGLMCALVTASRLVISTRTLHRVRRGRWSFNSLIVGCLPSADALRRVIERTGQPLGMNVVGFVNLEKEDKEGKENKESNEDKEDKEGTETNLSESKETSERGEGAETYAGLPVFGPGELAGAIGRLNIHSLVLEQGKRSLHSTLRVIAQLFPLDLPLLISPSMLNLPAIKPRLNNVAGEPLVDITTASLSPSTVNLKRAGDVVLSLLALVVLLPVYAVVAAAVKIDSRGPVFYRQERVGYRRKPFRIVKFRTMAPDAERDGPALSSANDPRITRVGRVLRKYRLDELPQFWNVLRGDMSLVGPRPERAFYIEQILRRAPYYTLIHQVRPGITSWGMVRYGYASDVDGMVRRLQYDLIYIENVSLLVDVKILFHTFATVFSGKGL